MRIGTNCKGADFSISIRAKFETGLLEGEHHIFEIDLMLFKIGSPLAFIPLEEGERFLLTIHNDT